MTFCSYKKEKNRNLMMYTKGVSDLERIKAQGSIKAITNYNSTDYFLYRGEPMGYQYDLLKLLAEHLQVNLEIVVSNDIQQMIESLNTGESDIIAINLTVTKERNKIISFTEPHSQTRQVLVQRKPDNWRNMTYSELDSHLIRNQLDLGGKSVFIQKGSTFYTRLRNLSDEIGDSIDIYELPQLEVEEIIRLVVDGDIDYTVCDENVAMVNQTYYPDIDIKTAISFPQNLAWAVRKESDELKAVIDKWLIDLKKTKKYSFIYNKYFRNSKSVDIVQSEFFSINSGKISQYDDIIKQYSKEIGWDWTLLASMMYQESKFHPEVKSWAGAFGLMQIMPSTGERFGIDSLSSPHENIAAGVRIIKWLDEQLTNKIADEDERIKFVLAAYNVGLGHVLDARRLAKKNRKDPNIWDNSVDFFILHKSNPNYFNDPVVKHGYCRGEEPYNYVKEVIERYEHYKNVISNLEEGLMTYK